MKPDETEKISQCVRGILCAQKWAGQSIWGYVLVCSWQGHAIPYLAASNPWWTAHVEGSVRGCEWACQIVSFVHCLHDKIQAWVSPLKNNRNLASFIVIFPANRVLDLGLCLGLGYPLRIERKRQIIWRHRNKLFPVMSGENKAWRIVAGH